ncbi:alpha/beta-hydrolase family protein [Actinomycetospora sp. CA-101289]|uniref:alpha/beta-hydrolase family protein n=1 Tax=Actinomycetospora sp. CA-101289 TaxID=3239893 RepID=UPI003D984A79
MSGRPVPAALLLAVSTAPPVLPRGLVTQLAESMVLAGLGWWAGRAWRGAPPGPVLVVATAAWVAVTLGGQDAHRVALGMPPVGWVPMVVAATVIVLVAGRGGRGRRVVTAGGVVLALAVTAAVVPAGASPPSRPSPPAEVVTPAVRPVHVAAGLGPGTPAGRADAAVRALAAFGGLARRTLVVVVPTGSGWVDPASLASLEAATGGDVATVALAYDDAPSWVSYLTARDEAVATTGALLAAVARARPPGSRVLLHGESLGALAGAQAWARHPDQADGAFWVGPPADTPTAPVAADGPVEVLAHPTDPAAIWSPRLLVAPPDRPVPVPWLPVVSFVQTSVDLLGAVGAPAGVGHHYGAEQQPGWARLLAATG